MIDLLKLKVFSLLVEINGQEVRTAFRDTLANPDTLVVELSTYSGTTFQIGSVSFSLKWTCNILQPKHTNLFIWLSRWLWE